MITHPFIPQVNTFLRSGSGKRYGVLRASGQAFDAWFATLSAQLSATAPTQEVAALPEQSTIRRWAVALAREALQVVDYDMINTGSFCKTTALKVSCRGSALGGRAGGAPHTRHGRRAAAKGRRRLRGGLRQRRAPQARAPGAAPRSSSGGGGGGRTSTGSGGSSARGGCGRHAQVDTRNCLFVVALCE